MSGNILRVMRRAEDVPDDPLPHNKRASHEPAMNRLN